MLLLSGLPLLGTTTATNGHRRIDSPCDYFGVVHTDGLPWFGPVLRHRWLVLSWKPHEMRCAFLRQVYT